MKWTSHSLAHRVNWDIPTEAEHLDQEDAKRLAGDYIDYYNTQRLHSAIGYITPEDRLEGRQDQIHAARDKKLKDAREHRKLRRQQLAFTTSTTQIL